MLREVGRYVGIACLLPEPLLVGFADLRFILALLGVRDDEVAVAYDGVGYGIDVCLDMIDFAEVCEVECSEVVLLEARHARQPCFAVELRRRSGQ